MRLTNTMLVSIATAATIAALFSTALADDWASRAEMTPKPVRSVDATPISPIRTCLNYGNALEAPNEGEWGPKITRADITAIAGQGFDTLRLPVSWSTHLDARDRIDPAFIARVDQVANWAIEDGMNVIINVHHFNELNENPLPNIPRLHKIWGQLASHYARWPDELIFEVINEPHDKFTQDLVNTVNHDALAGIRKTNPDRWVILGGAHWGGITPFTRKADIPFKPVTDKRTIATFHTYSPYEFTHQGVPFSDDPPPVGRRLNLRRDLPVMRGELRDAADFTRRTGMPMLLGEFGVYRKVPHTERVAWTKAMRQQADAQNIGWCYFDWQTEFRYADPDTKQPLPGMRDALFGR